MKRILIIEDEDRLRNMLRLSLERLGYTVAEARDGAEGLAQFAKQSPDLVLTDLVMPEKEGLETIQELSKRKPGLKIIAMTGGGRSDARDTLKMALHFGASLALSKPFALDSLASAVENLLEIPALD